jgi:hypothetical protein
LFEAFDCHSIGDIDGMIPGCDCDNVA